MVTTRASKNTFLGKLYLDIACYNTANHLSGIVNRISLTASQLIHCQQEIDSLRVRLSNDPLQEKFSQICMFVEFPFILDDAFFEKLYSVKKREIDDFLALQALLYEMELKKQTLFARQFNLQEHASEERIIKFFENIYKIINEITQQIENFSKQLENLYILQRKLTELVSTCQNLIDSKFSKISQEYASDNKIIPFEWKNKKYSINKHDIATAVSKILSAEIKAGKFITEITPQYKHQAVMELIKKIMPETLLSDSIIKSIGSKIEKEVESFGRFLTGHQQFNEINKISMKMNNAKEKLKIVEAEIDIREKLLNSCSNNLNLLEDEHGVYKEKKEKKEANYNENRFNELQRVVSITVNTQTISNLSTIDTIKLQDDELDLDDDEDMNLSNTNTIEKGNDIAKNYSQVSNPIINERRPEKRPAAPTIPNENTHNDNHEQQRNSTPRNRI